MSGLAQEFFELVEREVGTLSAERVCENILEAGFEVVPKCEAAAGNDAEQKLVRDMRRAAASHRRNGEMLTADLLERGAQKIARLLSSAQSEEVRHD